MTTELPDSEARGRVSALAAVEALIEDMKRIERMAGAAGYGETPAKPLAEIAAAAVRRVEGQG